MLEYLRMNLRSRNFAVAALVALQGFSADFSPTLAQDAAGPSKPSPAAAASRSSSVPPVGKPTADFAHPTPAGIEHFEKKIRPVLTQHCYKCHSAAASSIKGGLRLDTREGLRTGGESGAAVVPGDSESSLLMEALRFEGLEMPPTGKLSDQQIADFADWIAMGAPDPRTGTAGAKKKLDLAAARQFWAYQAPRKTVAPTVNDAAWPETDIDRFLLAAMEMHGLTPAADADKLTWLRRVTFDLIGLPPTLAEMEAYVADTSAGADAAVVDRLLASPQFGERWGRHWLDVARYGESTGKERNVPYTQAWRYRDWVIDSVNADKPYTLFIKEQIAGDLLPAANPQQHNTQLVATGLLALGPRSLNERNAEQYAMDTVDDQIDVVTRAFLATTVGCARCHDHKFDPIPTADYYALAGIFRSTETLSGVVGRSTKGVKNDYTGELMPLSDAASSPTAATKLSASDQAEYAKTSKRLEQRRADLAQLVRSAKNSSKNKEVAKNQAKKRFKALSQQIEEDERKLSELKSGRRSTSASSAFAMGVRDAAQPADTEIRLRGEPEEKGVVVPRGFVQVLKSSLTPKVDPRHSGRLELAQWIASRDNPLTARVMVNRIWSHLFGRGIVETVDNFGALGEEPSHRELLDFLALRFMDNDWSLKKSIREMVLSRAYRMSSAHDANDYAKDPGNRYFWRMNCRRLDAEAIRDAALAVAGTLDLSRPGVSPVAKLETSNEIGRRVSVDGLDSDVAQNRSVYLPLIRNAMPEVLAVFDVADPSLIVGQREVTTVATQALFLMNSPLILEQSQKAAELIMASSSDVRGRVDRAYRTILQRPPTADEIRRGSQFVEEYGQVAAGEKAGSTDVAWTALCQTLMSSAEFRYLY
jgi:cytochrome c553